MKLEFHYTYLIVALSFVLTGYFPNLLVFTSIIIFHELGHYTIAKLNHLEVSKIIIYPYGGVTKMNYPINTKIIQEISVALAGITFQIIYFFIITILYRQGLIRDYIYTLFKTYHQSILIFNLLPIHPLDGSIILNLLLSKVFPYKLTLKLNILFSIITIILLIKLNYYNFNYTTILIISVILDSIFKYYKNINYLFNKFLLERYLHTKKYPHTKVIHNLNQMYKEKTHIIKKNDYYLTEKQALNERFHRIY